MLIKKIISFIIIESRFLRSFFMSRYLRIQQKKKLNKNSIKGSVLILVPHADDEWIGNSQLFNNPKISIELINMNMQGGDSEELHKKRYEELTTLATKMNVPIINLEGNYHQKVIKLRDLVLKKRPMYISIPFFIDWHKEHIEVNNIFMESISKLKNIVKDINIIMYQVSVPIPISLITEVVEMNKNDLNKKWLFFKNIYKTQAFFPIKRFKYNEFVNGALCDKYAAEVFCCKPCEEWLKFFKKYHLNENNRLYIEQNFMNLIKIRKIIKKLIEE